MPPSWGWGSPGDQEGVRKWPFPVPSARSALWEGVYSSCSHRGSPAHCLPMATSPPEASGQLGTPGLPLAPSIFAGSGEKRHVAFPHGPCFPGRLFRKNRPSESNRMDESHLSPGGGQTTHVHPAFSALPPALGAWMNGFSSETPPQLQFVSGQHSRQDQGQARNSMGAKPRQGVEDGGAKGRV